MLCTLTEGPLHIGMGRGTAKLEYDALRVPMTEARDRFRECWEVMQLALAGKPFRYHGRHLKLDREIIVRPRARRQEAEFLWRHRQPRERGDHGRPRPAAAVALPIPRLSAAEDPRALAHARGVARAIRRM